MEVYIKITQTTGTGKMEIRFPFSSNNTIWYSDTDLVFHTIENSDFKYETKYTIDTVDTANLKLEFYEVDSNQLVKTINIEAISVNATPILTSPITELQLGNGITTQEIISPTVLINASNLIVDIKLEHNDDGSFYISGDDGLTYYRDLLPISAIVWVVDNVSFNLKIKRKYTDTWGLLYQDIKFSNAGNEFTIATKSEFEIDNINAPNEWIKGKGDRKYSIVSRDGIYGTTNVTEMEIGGITRNAYRSFLFGANNDVTGTYSFIFGSGNEIMYPQQYAFTFGKDNQNKSSYSITIGNECATTGLAAVAIGDVCDAGGYSSFAQGYHSSAPGQYSLSIGNGNSTFPLISAGLSSKNLSAQVSVSTQYGAYANFSGLFAGVDNKVEATAERSVIIGGSNITATVANTVYVPNLNIQEGLNLNNLDIINNTPLGAYIISMKPTGELEKMRASNFGIGYGATVSATDTNHNANIGGWYNYIGNGSYYNGSIGGYDCDFNTANAAGQNGYNFLGGGKRNDVLTGVLFGAIVAGEQNELQATSHSVIIGGSNITATLSDTTYVPNLVIDSTPTTSTDATPTFLVRDESTKQVKKITNTSWTIPTLNSGWDLHWYDLNYMKTADGTIFVRGEVQRDTAEGGDKTIFTLPVGFRPPQHMHVITSTSDGASYGVLIRDNGIVECYPDVANGAYVGLGFSFHI